MRIHPMLLRTDLEYIFKYSNSFCLHSLGVYIFSSWPFSLFFTFHRHWSHKNGFVHIIYDIWMFVIASDLNFVFPISREWFFVLATLSSPPHALRSQSCSWTIFAYIQWNKPRWETRRTQKSSFAILVAKWLLCGKFFGCKSFVNLICQFVEVTNFSVWDFVFRTIHLSRRFRWKPISFKEEPHLESVQSFKFATINT